MTALENSQYGWAATYFAAMIGEQVLTALTFGQGAAVKQGTQCVLNTAARTAPRNLAEQLALEEAKGGAGKRIMEDMIKDPRYPKELWAKMQHVHTITNPDGSKTHIVIHYWRNLKTGLQRGFKFT